MPKLLENLITFIDSFNKLSGPSCGQPINEIGLKLYTDSLVCLSWLNSCIDKLD